MISCGKAAQTPDLKDLTFPSAEWVGGYTACHTSMPSSYRSYRVLPVLLVLLAVTAPPAAAQIVESVGTRAMGMGGAFVAVATDSTATWWNPAALAAGPFMDVAIGRGVTDLRESLPARRDRASWFTLGSPPFGFSYYRLRLTDAAVSPTAQERADREEGAGAAVRTVALTQLGATVVQTLLPGVHAGATLKYLRGTLRQGEAAAAEPAELLDDGEDLEGGDGQSRFDLDLGLIGTAGPIRLGGLIRNVRQPEFTTAGATAPGLRLPRQVRVGAAFDAEKATAVAFTLSIDADLRGYTTATGERKVVAVGAEQWLLARRLGLRAGARFNRVGGQERAGTAGVSVAVRSGLYLEAHYVGGGTADERGWGVDTRVSF